MHVLAKESQAMEWKWTKAKGLHDAWKGLFIYFPIFGECNVKIQCYKANGNFCGLIEVPFCTLNPSYLVLSGRPNVATFLKRWWIELRDRVSLRKDCDKNSRTRALF